MWMCLEVGYTPPKNLMVLYVWKYALKCLQCDLHCEKKGKIKRLNNEQILVVYHGDCAVQCSSLLLAATNDKQVILDESRPTQFEGFTTMGLNSTKHTYVYIYIFYLYTCYYVYIYM